MIYKIRISNIVLFLTIFLLLLAIPISVNAAISPYQLPRMTALKPPPIITSAYIQLAAGPSNLFLKPRQNIRKKIDNNEWYELPENRGLSLSETPENSSPEQIAKIKRFCSRLLNDLPSIVSIKQLLQWFNLSRTQASCYQEIKHRKLPHIGTIILKNWHTKEISILDMQVGFHNFIVNHLRKSATSDVKKKVLRLINTTNHCNAQAKTGVKLSADLCSEISNAIQR